MTLEAFGLALLIFGLRIFNNAIGTVRVVMITRDMRFWAAVFGFIEALTFVVVIAGVAKDLSNLPNLMAYCLGFAVGGYIGAAASYIHYRGFGNGVAGYCRTINGIGNGNRISTSR